VSGAWVLLCALVALGGQAPPAPEAAAGQPTEFEVTAALVGDLLPRRDVSELRPSVSVTVTRELSRMLTLRGDASVEALAADRDGVVGAIRAEVRDAWIEVRRGRADLRAGYGRLVWGRLDEIAPTDVINPLDATKFLLEGRTEARLAVPFVRGRVGSERVAIEGVIVPFFRRGRFDRLDETTSPFNLTVDLLPVGGIIATVPQRAQREPDAAFGNVSGGARVQVTTGRVDVAGSVYRGFDGVGPLTTEVGPFGANGGLAMRLVEHHPRFTMIGADFETVTGPWAWRGEVASFVERTFTGRTRPGFVAGRSLDAGIGFDRRIGDVRVFGSVIAHREWSDEDPAIDRTDVNLVGSIERSFGRDRYLARAFVVGNPQDEAAFVRGLIAWRATDAVAIEASGGLFLGTSDDTIGRFRGRDFALGKFRVWF
jgi:hypothetical protein